VSRFLPRVCSAINKGYLEEKGQLFGSFYGR
jgi:hypothetical protein